MNDDASSQIDDPDNCLEHFFAPNDDAEAYSLDHEERFPPEVMFEVNEKKYNVKSSYNENLEGYT